MRRQHKLHTYIFLVIVATLVVNLLWAFSPLPGLEHLWDPVVEVDDGAPLNICHIAVGITTTARYQNRTNLQEKTWLTGMCPKKSNFRFVTDEKNSANINAVFSACPTDYNSVCCKTADLVHKMYEIFPMKRWFMKCDDDSYVVPDRAVEFLSELNHTEPILTGLPYYVVLANMCTVPRTRHNCTAGSPRPHIGGDFNYKSEDNFAYPAGGPCYAFSNELARRMVEHDLMSEYSKYCNKLSPFEDLMISRIASDVGGYFVSGSRYFSSGAANENTIKQDKACCYHMARKDWSSMDKVHAALIKPDPEPETENKPE